MAKLLKLRRGTTSQHSSFTGAEGEVTVDTDKETLVVHDGSTAGGHPLALESANLSLIDEDNMATNSATRPPSQQSVKAYVDAGDAAVPTTITVADESSDTTCFPVFVTAATGDLAPKTGSNITFNSSTGLLTAVGLTLSGNLTVNGTTTTVATTNTTVTDNLLELNSGAGSNANDSGILIERGSTGDNAIIAWDESEDKFVVGTTTATNDATGNISITTGTLVANVEGNVTGTASGNAVLTGSTNNEIVTVTGANAIQGETKLTFDGATLDFAINNSSQGFKIGASGNHIPIFTFDANRTAADDNLGQTLYKWNGTEVARVSALAGADTTNKDDGKLVFYTRESGSSLAAALTLDTSQNATFAGTVTDSKGNLRSIPPVAKSSAHTLVASDAGKVIYTSSGEVTIPFSVLSAGDAVTIINNSGSNITLTEGGGGTLYNTQTGVQDSSLTLAGRGMVTVWYASATVAYISGSGVS